MRELIVFLMGTGLTGGEGGRSTVSCVEAEEMVFLGRDGEEGSLSKKVFMSRVRDSSSTATNLGEDLSEFMVVAVFVWMYVVVVFYVLELCFAYFFSCLYVIF
jgi:hypothetical protein